MLTVAEMGIPHFSAYALTVEDKTALQYAIANKKAAPVNPDQAAAQFELLMELVAATGYEHYEISNLARPGHYAIHNTNYWRGNKYLGIGPSAHSFNGVSRRWNMANNALYAKSILLEGHIPFEEEQLSRAAHLNEYIMTSLRTAWGCDLDVIEQEWDSPAAKVVENYSRPFESKGWLRRDKQKLMLTNKGKLFADKVAAEMFVDNDFA